MKPTPLRGIIAAPFTPLHPDGSINCAVVPRYAQKLKADGVAGVFINGTTGEGLSLRLDERMDLAEAWGKEQSETFAVVVNVSSESLPAAQQLAAQAEALEVAGIGMMGPVFFGVRSAEELAGFCAATAAKAPGRPFYYYHIPSMSGVTVSMPTFLEAAAPQIPQLAGVKFSHTNFMEMQQCLHLHDRRYTVLHGSDEMLLAGLALGVHGAIGSTYNYMAPVYHRIIAAFEAGDWETARHWQYYSVQVVETLLRHRTVISASKALMQWLGVDCGPCRAPLPSLTAAELVKLRQDLDRLQFFEKIR